MLEFGRISTATAFYSAYFNKNSVKFNVKFSVKFKLKEKIDSSESKILFTFFGQKIFYIIALFSSINVYSDLQLYKCEFLHLNVNCHVVA